MLRVLMIATLMLVGAPSLADDRDDRREAKREAKEQRAEQRQERLERKAERRERKAERREAKWERKLAKWESKTPKTQVCDPLKASSTPGLYGMCLKYCEARDVPGLFAEGKVSAKKAERFAKRQERVLERYNATKTAADPDMPCISQEICPCWSSNQASLSFWNDKSAQPICGSQDTGDFRLSEIGANAAIDDPEYTRMQAISFSQDGGATFTHYCANEDAATTTSMMEQINDTEAIICATQVQTACNMLEAM